MLLKLEYSEKLTGDSATDIIGRNEELKKAYEKVFKEPFDEDASIERESNLGVSELLEKVLRASDTFWEFTYDLNGVVDVIYVYKIKNIQFESINENGEVAQ